MIAYELGYNYWKISALCGFGFVFYIRGATAAPLITESWIHSHVSPANIIIYNSSGFGQRNNCERNVPWQKQTRVLGHLNCSMRRTNVKSGLDADFSVGFRSSASMFDNMKGRNFVTKAESISTHFSLQISLLWVCGLCWMWLWVHVINKTESQSHNLKQQIIVLQIYIYFFKKCPKC